MFTSHKSSIILLLSIFFTSCNGSTTVGSSVQLFEWSWEDVAYECENYLSVKGFEAVQVSPPMEHIQGSQWWTRYQPVSYNLTSRSGNETQFADMVKRCNAVNVQIIVDAVFNHMAAGSGTGIAGSKYGSRTFPIYSPTDFHHYDNNLYSNCAVTDYTNKYNVQYCDLVGLPDLMTSSSNVQTRVVDYIMSMYNYGVRGIRIDAAKHQDDGEMSGIINQLPDDLYVGQEVIGASGEAVQPSMYYSTGQVSEFYYADYLDANIINEYKMHYLQTFGESWGLMPDAYAAAFLDNHDTQRNGRAQLTYKNGDLYTFANVFMLAWPYANVRVMSSYYFTNTDAGPPSVGVAGGANCMDGVHWVCEHRWGPIGNMAKWRVAANKAGVSNWQNGNDYNQIAFGRNGAAFIAMNRGSSVWYASNLVTGMPSGVYCNIIGDINQDNVATCSTVTVDSNGLLSTSVPALKAVAIHIYAKKS